MMASSHSSHACACLVSVPATTANLGPGFDCLGLALNLRNQIRFTRSGQDLPYDVHSTDYAITVSGIDAGKIPLDSSNLAIQAAESIFQRIGCRPMKLVMEMVNSIPVGSGLGSSSSAIIAGLSGAHALYGEPIEREDILGIAVAMEGHPDNVAPAMMGGLVLGVLPDPVSGPSELIVHRWDPPNLSAVVVLPDFHLLTSEARAVLPLTISRADAIFNTSRLGLLIHALTGGDTGLLQVAMSDRLHQNYRLRIIPGAQAALTAAYQAGASGVALSGAGPSLIAFTTGDGRSIARVMIGAFQDAGLDSRVWFLSPSAEGVNISVSNP